MTSNFPKITPETFQKAIISAIGEFTPGGDDSGYALPPATLAVIGRLILVHGLKKIFEFGSGKSTKYFLSLGCDVFSVEDSHDWLAATTQTISAEEKLRWRTFCKPLERIWLRLVPVRSWHLDPLLIEGLRSADLVLVDSPGFPPFREHALIASMSVARSAIVVVDDARIPTVNRFCARIATRNGLPHYYAPIDHGLFFLLSPGVNQDVDSSRGCLEFFKGWRRYFMSLKSTV